MLRTLGMRGRAVLAWHLRRLAGLVLIACAGGAAAGDYDGDGRPDVVLTPSESAGSTYRTSWFEAPVDPKSPGWTRHDIETGIGDWVVENGLSGGETIIVGGLNRIRPGIPVKTVAYKDSSASSKPTASSN